jgi:hypothetical protein
MTYYSATELRQRVTGVTIADARSELSRLTKTAGGTYDVFLSHSLKDALLILGLKRLLESDGLRVYVDWVDDPHLDRTNVNAATAARLRDRMRACSSLVYATSANSSASRWMPWELGFFDGYRGADRVAICPIQDGGSAPNGEEYLGLYKTLEKVLASGLPRPFLIRSSRDQAENVKSFTTGQGAYVSLSWGGST